MLKRGKFAVALFALAVFLFLPLVSFADSTTFNAIFFHPATGRNPYLMLHGTETLYQLQFDVGDYFSYGYHPLNIRQANTRVRGVIDHLVVSDFVVAVGAMDWLQFGIDFPLVLINKFGDPFAATVSSTKNHFNIGDLRIEAKARVLNSCSNPVGLAFIPFVTIPTGNDSHFVGDPGVSGGLKIALDGRVHELIGLTLNLGYQAGRKVNVRNITYQHRFLIGGGVDAMLPYGIDVFGEINAVSAFNKLFHNRDMNQAEAMAGARWDIKETGVSLQAGAGSCLVCGTAAARIRAVLGAKYRFYPPKYRQKDMQEEQMCLAKFGKGVSLDQFQALKMQCPANPADYVAGQYDAACPKYYEIRELADLVLRCPSKPEDFDPKYHDAACPKVFNLSDAYSSKEIQNIYTLSVAEMSILCPSNPADFNPSLHDIGCPKYYDLREVAALANICPSSADQYKEGVDDPSCPKFYTLKDSYSADQWAGLTKLSSEDLARYATDGIAGGEIQTLNPVYFDFSSAKIKPEAIAAIDGVIAVINKTPWVSRVRVGGNADARGTPEANNLIAKKRSDVVIAYMRTHGVRPDVDFEAISYGANRPAASNDTEKGRSLNRRVAFVVTGFHRPFMLPVKKPAPVKAKALEVAPQPAVPQAPKEEEPTSPPQRWE